MAEVTDENNEGGAASNVEFEAASPLLAPDERIAPARAVGEQESSEDALVEGASRASCASQASRIPRSKARLAVVGAVCAACIAVIALFAGFGSFSPVIGDAPASNQAEDQSEGRSDDAESAAGEADESSESQGEDAAEAAGSADDAAAEGAEQDLASGDSAGGAGGSNGSAGGAGGSGASGSGSSGAGASADGQESRAPSAPDPAPATITVSVSIDSSRAHAYDSAWPSSMGSRTVALSQGASAYDALRAMGVSIGGSSSYVSSINGLAEFSCGQGSGWMYSVNGVFPSKACGKYKLSGGESVRWVYTCNLGNDL